MSRRTRELSPEEQELWRRVAASVEKRAKPIAAPPASAPALTHAQRAAPAQPAMAKSSAPPADRSGERRVRRGRLEIGGALDLHGYSQDRARSRLLRFLDVARCRGDGAVLAITGVGRTGEGVLKRRLPDWLSEPEFRRLVSGFAPAHRKHGGAGAFYIFLRRQE